MDLHLPRVVYKKKTAGEFIFRPIEDFKFTFKPKFNNVHVRRLRQQMEVEGLDLVNATIYDIRVKWYINSRVSLIGRTLLAGSQTEKYYYSLGCNLIF